MRKIGKNKGLFLLFIALMLFGATSSIIQAQEASKPSPSAEPDPKAENDRTYYENALSLYNLKQYEKALINLGEYIELFPDGAFRKDALRKIGDIYLSRFDYKKALKYYEFLYQEFSSDEDGIGGYFQMGICYSRMGNTSKAIEIFKDIVQLYPASRYQQKARTQLEIEEMLKK